MTGRSTISSSARRTSTGPRNSINRSSAGIPGLRTGLHELPGWPAERRLHEGRAGPSRQSAGGDLRRPARSDRSEDQAGGREDRPKDIPVPRRPPVPLQRSERQRAGRVDRSVALVTGANRGVRVVTPRRHFLRTDPIPFNRHSRPSPNRSCSSPPSALRVSPAGRSRRSSCSPFSCSCSRWRSS